METTNSSSMTISSFMYKEIARKIGATGTQSEIPMLGAQEGCLHGELRHPRQFFTNALTTLFQRLDVCAEKDVTWKSPFPWIEPSKGVERIAVKKVWVAGSYLRGAPTCGDLDLIVEVDPVGHAVTAGNIKNAFFRGLKDVRPFFGTPEENSSGIAMPDARLIWERGMNWQDALAGIKENTNAGRFPRLTDRLPFRMEQMSLELYRAEGIIAALDKNLVRWMFISFDSIDKETMGAEISEVLAFVKDHSVRSKKAAPIYELLACVLHERYGLSSEELMKLLVKRNGRPTAGISLEIGSSRVPVEQLDDYNVERLIVCPYPTTRGPNGIWVIERGDHHPLVAAAAKRQAYAVFRQENPDFFYFETWGLHRGIDLWATQAKAVDWRETLVDANAEESQEFPENWTVVELTGRPLLSVLSKVELVALDEDLKALSRAGLDAADRPEIVPIDNLLNELPLSSGKHDRPSDPTVASARP